jgi:predicted nucleotidyltransferase
MRRNFGRADTGCAIDPLASTCLDSAGRRDQWRRRYPPFGFVVASRVPLELLISDSTTFLADVLAVIPTLGMIIPQMGIRTLRRPGLADALFTPVQQRVLALLFGQPNRRYQSAELIRLARGGSGAVQRQLARLEDVGLVEVSRSGNQKYYQARRDSPVFEELHGLVVKTVALVEPLREVLAARADEIRAAFVYGSTADGTDRASSDIDVLVVSDSVTYADVYEALQSIEATLARPVNPTVITVADWKRKRATSGTFVARLMRTPRLFIIGGEDDLH